MKKLLVLVLVSVLVFGCKKDEDQKPEVTQQDVSFGIVLVDPDGNGLKDWECKNLEPDYAQITIMDDDTDAATDYFPQVFRINGHLYTQNIKLDVGNYTVTNFILWDDGNTPGGALPDYDPENGDPYGDDQIVMGAPQSNSLYYPYVTKALNLPIVVNAFEKAEYELDVLCFQETDYTAFGFTWFAINEIVIREQCFFGDICIKDIAGYSMQTSPYLNQTSGIQLDMPAIVELHVYTLDDEGDPVYVHGSPFTNANSAANWGVGAPVCIQYPDRLDIEETFYVDLYIAVKCGDAFPFKYFHTWSFMDDQVIPNGGDGIVEFVLGQCNLSGTDLQLAPYQDIPTMANISIGYPGDPGYWDITVNTVSPPGSYELMPGLHFGFCGDVYTTITSPQTFDAYVYPSLYDNDWPAGMPFDLSEIATVNWIFNNLDLFGMDIMNLTSAQGDDLQDAIWYLLNDGYGVPNAIATAAAGQTNFQPLPGGWAAVCFVKDDNPQAHQLLFVVVDP